MAQGVCSCKRDRLWVRFPLETMKCSCFGNKAKRSVEFNHSTLLTQHVTPPEFIGKLGTKGSK